MLELITDQENNNWEFGYTKTGLLHSGTDPLGNNSRYAYDERGRLDLAILPDGSQVTYEYDDASNVTGIHYGGGLDIDYSYDDLSRLDTTNNLDLDYDSEGRVTNSEYRGNNFGATYTNDGRLQTATYNNNHMIVTYTYDPANGRLTNVTDDLTGATVGFTYDNDGLLTGMTRSNGVNGTYTYDGAGRLDRIQDGEIIDLSYTLDAVGQVEQVDMNVPLAPWDCLNTKNDTFNYDAASQVISTGYSYDPLGRRITSSDNTYTWNGASQLTSPDEFTDLSYNGLGEIASRGVIGATTHYYHNHTIGLSPIVAEERVIPGPFTSQFTRYYVWTPGGKLLYMIDLEDSNEVYFYHFDITGSTLALSDSSGNVTDSYAYTPYGELLQHEGSMSQPFTYVGAGGVRQEGENGDLYQMRARYYDATTASFLSRDPVWPDISEPKALNPYSYAGQDPVTNVDLTGLRSYSINNRYSYYNYYSRYYGEYGPWSHGGYYQSYYKWYWRYDSRYSKLYSRQSTGRATAFSDKWLYDQNTGQWTRGRNIGSSSTSGNWEPIVGDWDGAGYDSVGSNNQQYIFWHCNPNTGQWPQGRNSSSHDVWYYNPNTGQWTQGSNSSCIDIRNNSPWVEIGSRSDVIVSPDISNAGSEIPHMLNPGLFQFGVRVSY